jgi:methylated-DNA-[protein]-cysteine S-methyltransferase
MDENNTKIMISTYKYKNLYFAVGVSKAGKIVWIALPQENEKDAIAEILKQYHPDQNIRFEVSSKYTDIAKKVCRVYNGENVKFHLDSLDLNVDKSKRSSIKTPFERDVLLEVAKIPYGEVRTYKQIGEEIGTKGYRAVGTAVGKNPFPIIIPCHRVVKSDLRIGEYRGGSEMKNEILKNEGIKIKGDKITKK